MKKKNLIIYSIVIICSLFCLLSKVSASTSTIKVSTSESTVSVGDTFTTNVTVSSSNYFTSYEYIIKYDDDTFKLVSGDVHKSEEGKWKSVTNTYKFKALKKDSSTISVKSYSVVDYDTYKLNNVTVSGTTIKVGSPSSSSSTSDTSNTTSSIKLTVDGNEYTLIDDKTTLKKLAPSGFVLSTKVIKNQKVNVLYYEKSDLTLVALKDFDDNTLLYIYNDGDCTLFNLFTSHGLRLIIEKNTDDPPSGWKKDSKKVNNEVVTVYRNSYFDNYYLIYATDIDTNDTNWYLYDIKNKTAVLFDKNILSKSDLNKVKDDEKVLLIVIGILLIAFITSLIVIITKNKSKKRH